MLVYQRVDGLDFHFEKAQKKLEHVTCKISYIGRCGQAIEYVNICKLF